MFKRFTYLRGKETQLDLLHIVSFPSFHGGYDSAWGQARDRAEGKWELDPGSPYEVV